MKWEGEQESENVEDRRSLKPAAAAGGGILTLLIVVGAYFLGFDPRQAQQIAQKLENVGGHQTQEVGPPVNDKTKKFVATVLNFTEDVWTDQFRQMGEQYQKPKLVLFRESVDSEGCGVAPSAVGPFYCPVSKKVFLDPSFFDELEQKLGGSKAEFSQAYVIAHEVGHHVQNLLGYSDKVRQFERREGKNGSVRLELQADYLAGVWAHHGQKKFNFVERGDIESAITTAKAIGDDRLQKRSQGWVSPEGFTHGTSEQRIRAFTEGFKSGDASKRALDRYFDPNTDPLKL
ncbi:MAG: neutral zinc metallopeptidase [Gemmataceae bacterium]